MSISLESCTHAPSAAAAGERVVVPVRLRVGCPGGKIAEPFVCGVPLPQGSLREPLCGQLSCAQWPDLPVSATVLATWTDGSAKWVLVEGQLPPLSPGNYSGVITLSRHSKRWQAQRESTGALEVHQDDRQILVNTGQLTCRLGANSSEAPIAVFERREGNARWELSLRLFETANRPRRINWERPVVEAANSARVTMRHVGHVVGKRHLKMQVRLHLYRNSELVKCEATIHNARPARHRGGCWDLGDAGSEHFTDLSLVWQGSRELQLQTFRAALLSLDGSPPTPFPAGNSSVLTQFSSGGDNWHSPVHMDARGVVPLSRRGYQWRCESSALQTGKRATPVAACPQQDATLLLAPCEFWQQYPKSLRLTPHELSLGMFPHEAGIPFELQGGERKRHAAWFCLGDAGLAPTDLVWVHGPSAIAATPAWHAASGAWDDLLPASEDPSPHTARVAELATAGPHNFFVKRETIDEYGWRHYGDMWADHECAHYAGPGHAVSHYNNQFDLLYVALRQWIRSEMDAWQALADPLARHVLDIDIYHTTADKAAFSGGMFWHTDHYVTAHTATHRTYSGHNRGRFGQDYGGGPSNEHNYAQGLRFYYYLTGDPEARSAVLGLADWVIAMDDGARAPWCWIDEGPTGLASRTRDDHFHGPGRGAGNSLSVLLDAWELSHEARYLDFAQSLLRRVVHPRDDVASLDLLDVENRWSYTVFLAALARFLKVKTVARQCDDHYVYARQSLLAYAAWMAEHERPYLDQADKLEYVTETWPAQDLRKANVLRLAAQYADAGLRDRLNAKADAISAGAWEGLWSFPRPDTTRALTLALGEGSREAYLLVGPAPPLPPPLCEPSLADPVHFVSSRTRAKEMLRSPQSWPRLAVRALYRLLSGRSTPTRA